MKTAAAPAAAAAAAAAVAAAAQPRIPRHTPRVKPQGHSCRMRLQKQLAGNLHQQAVGLHKNLFCGVFKMGVKRVRVGNWVGGFGGRRIAVNFEMWHFVIAASNKRLHTCPKLEICSSVAPNSFSSSN